MSSTLAPPSIREGLDKDSEAEAWGLLDALDWRQKPVTHQLAGQLNSLEISITDAISTTSPEWIQGSTFKSWEDGERPPWEDMVIPNFPDLNDVAPDERTSEPITQGVEKQVQQDMLDLVTRERLRELLEAPMGMVRFSEFVNEEGRAGSAELLRYYKDVRAQAILVQEVKALSQALHTTYFERQQLSAAFKGLSGSPSQCLPSLSSAVLAMSSVEDEVLDRLYATEFKRFISGRITEQASACLGAFTDQADRGDLGEIYCLADPRQHDTPLVYVSDGFCELSEYPRSRLVGRNCRFLQGPGTDTDAVRLLRDAIKDKKEHTSLLLNYTRTGKPFWNLLTLIPLRNASGAVDFYLGAQINVTRALTSRRTFEALTGMTEKGRSRNAISRPSIDLSETVLSAAQQEIQSPLIIRQAVTAVPEPISPVQIIHPSRSGSFDYQSVGLQIPRSPSSSSGSSQHEETGLAPRKMQRWYSDIKTRTSRMNLRRNQTAEDISPTSGTPIMQEVESSVREHMANFASVYSKIILFRASDRHITHVTPALLAFLGHPIKDSKDRLSSSLIGTDILDLLADSGDNAAGVTRRIVAKSISEASPHSFFTGVRLHHTGHPSSGEEGEVSQSGVPFTRALLHITPVKDGNDKTVKYVLVVG